MSHFHVIGRDYPGEPERRQAARTDHLALAEKLAGEGKLIHAGALLDEGGAMIGSVLLYNVESREALGQLLKDEPYITQNVFQDVQITEYKPAPFFTG